MDRYVPPHRLRRAGRAQQEEAPEDGTARFRPPGEDARRADAAGNLHRMCTDIQALLTGRTAADGPVMPQTFAGAVHAVTEAARTLGLSNLDPVLAEAVSFKLAVDGGPQPAENILEDFQERVCKKWMHGTVEESGLAGHCHHIVSLTEPMAAGRSRMTVRSLCQVMAFLATLARAVGVNLGEVTRFASGPQNETDDAEPEPQPEPPHEPPFSPLRKWAHDNLDDPTWTQFESSRDELQESLAVHGLERVDSSKVPMYRSAPMRKQAAAQMIGDFRLRVSELEQLAQHETEAKARAEQVVRQRTNEDAVVDAQIATVQAQIALIKQDRAQDR